MQLGTRSTIGGLVTLFTVSLFIAVAQASPEKGGGGQPPFGLAIQGNAPGTKLDGTVVVEAEDVRPCDNSAGALRVIMRLNLNNDFATFFAHLTCGTAGAGVACSVYSPSIGCNTETQTRINLDNANGIQLAIIAVMRTAILSEFGFSPTASIVLRNAQEFETILGDALERITVGLVEFAVK